MQKQNDPWQYYETQIQGVSFEEEEIALFPELEEIVEEKVLIPSKRVRTAHKVEKKRTVKNIYDAKDASKSRKRLKGSPLSYDPKREKAY